MTDIQIFSNPQFGEIRTAIGENGEPMFCLPDLCRVLELTPSKVAQRLGDDVLSKYPITDALGREQMANFINEDGLYDSIFDSRKPEARKFRKWVTSEVLPTIRKTGGYIATKADDTPEMIMARAVLVAQATIEKQSKQIAEQSAKIEADAPKVLFHDAVIGSKSSCLIGELAKVLTQNGYKIGQNRLFQWLRENGYLGKHGEYYNMPNQRYVEMGLFETKKRVHDENGVLVTTQTTKVTGRGQSYFINKFLNR